MWFVNADVYQKLVARFKLKPRSETAHPLGLSDAVVPVTDADALRRTLTLKTGQANISAGAATLLTVPTGKVYHLYSGWRYTTVGTCQLQLSDGTNATVLSATTTSDQVTHFPKPIPAPAGWLVKLSQGNVADTAVYYGICYEDEDVS